MDDKILSSSLPALTRTIEALCQANYRFNKISEHVPGMLYQFRIDSQGKMTFPFTTDGIVDIYGVTPAQAAEDARIVTDRLHPDDLAMVIESITRSRETLEDWRCVYRVIHPIKGEIWVEGEAGPEDQEDGSTIWHGYIREVTKSVTLQQQVITERDRLESVIWGTGVGTWEWNVQTGETRFNERWAEIVGYTRQELMPINISTWVSLCHPDDLARSGALLQKHFDGQTEFYECEARMKHKLGHWVWVLDRGRIISWSPDGKPEWMAGTHLDITERKHLEEQLLQMATHDSLTGLPKRGLMMERAAMAISQAQRRKKKVAVAFVDLDGFKEVNDTYGHDVGDRVLIQTANRLASQFRAEDTVARHGGDEFIIVVADLDKTDSGMGYFDRAVKAIREPIYHQGHAIQVSCSIGVTYYTGGDVDVEGMLKKADQAMYEAKRAGKNQIVIG